MIRLIYSPAILLLLLLCLICMPSCTREPVSQLGDNVIILPPELIKTYPSNNAIVLDWPLSPNAKSYTVYWDTKPTITKNSPKFENIQPPFLHDNIENNVVYYYKISTVFGANESKLSTLIEEAAPNGITIPVAPTSVKAFGKPHEIHLEWEHSNKGKEIYTVYWSNKPNVSLDAYKIENTTSPFIHKNLLENRTYYYKVAAKNSFGESPLSSECVARPVTTTKIPMPPHSLISNVDSTSIRIQWQPVSTAISYNIYWSLHTDSSSFTKTTDVTSPFIHTPPKNVPVFYFVTSVNKSGESNRSHLIGNTLSPITNNTPIIVKKESGFYKTTIGWINNASNITNRLYWSKTPGVTIQSQFIDSVQSHFTHNNLLGGVPYFYKVCAFSPNGTSKFSEEFKITPLKIDSLPIAPQNIVITEGDRQLSLSWKQQTAISHYSIYWDTINTVTKTSNNFTTIDTPVIHYNLKNHQKYFYRITAHNKFGESKLSPLHNGTPKPHNSTPQPPTNISATSGNESIILNWNTVVNASHYSIYWSKDSLFSTVQTISNATPPFQHKKLTNGIRYHYYVTAVNTHGESTPSEIVRIQPVEPTMPPLTPQNFKAVGTHKMIHLSWIPAINTEFYRIYYSSTTNVNQSSSYIEIIAPQQNVFSHKNIPLNQSIYYRISAGNSVGFSALSPLTQATAVITNEPPKNLSIIPGNTKAVLNWTNNIQGTINTLYYDTQSPVTVNSPHIKGLTSPFLQVGLQKGTTYYYRVSTTSAFGEGDLSSEKSVTIGMSTPVNISAQQNQSSIQLTWDYHPDYDSVLVFYQSTPNVSSTAPTRKVPNKPYSFLNMDITKNHYFKIAYLNDIDTGDLSTEVNTTGILPIPQNVTLVPQKNSVTISWDTIQQSLGYSIEYATSPSFSPSETRLTDKASESIYFSTAGTKYFRVRALYNNNVTSLPSPTQSIYIDTQDHLSLLWKYSTYGRVTSSAAQGYNGHFFIGSSDSYLRALDKSGNLLWKYKAQGTIIGSPAINTKGFVFFGCTGGYFYGISPTGSLQWKIELSGEITTSPSITPDNIVYIGTAEDDYQDHLYALDGNNGEVLWRTPTTSSHGSPAIHNNRIYLPTNNGIRTHNRLSSNLIWEYKTDFPVFTNPAITLNSGIVFSTSNGELHHLSTQGVLLWKRPLHAPVSSSPIIDSEGNIYIGTSLGQFYKLSPNGEIIWVVSQLGPLNSTASLGIDGLIYIGSNNNTLYIIKKDGTILKKFETGGSLTSSALLSYDGILIIGSGDKHIYAIQTSSLGVENSRWPMFRGNSAHTGYVP